MSLDDALDFTKNELNKLEKSCIESYAPSKICFPHNSKINRSSQTGDDKK